MAALERPDLIHLNAAERWPGLGNHIEANEELEHISPDSRAHPQVLEIRHEVYAMAQRWEACLDIAHTLVKLRPRRSFGWIRRSYALHELKRTEEAFSLLLPAAGKFPKEWNIAYNLACYCAQLGRIPDCESWFRMAMAIDEHGVKQTAVDDPDLAPFWDSMGGSSWKRPG